MKDTLTIRFTLCVGYKPNQLVGITEYAYKFSLKNV